VTTKVYYLHGVVTLSDVLYLVPVTAASGVDNN